VSRIAHSYLFCSIPQFLAIQCRGVAAAELRIMTKRSESQLLETSPLRTSSHAIRSFARSLVDPSRVRHSRLVMSKLEHATTQPRPTGHKMPLLITTSSVVRYRAQKCSLSVLAVWLTDRQCGMMTLDSRRPRLSLMRNLPGSNHSPG
jgi:hypothetical protein